MAMNEEDARKQKMANDAIARQPTYKHNRETSWNTYLLERTDYIDALNLTAVLGADLGEWKKKALLLSLKNQAKELASSISAEDRRNLTYEQLENRLSGIFCPPAESQLLKQSFKSLKQRGQEDITHYLSQKESLYKRAYAEAERSMDFLIESTIRGVFNMEVRRKLADARFDANNPLATFEQLRRCALSSVASERAKMEWGVSESKSMDGLMQTTFVQNKFQEEDEVEAMEIEKIGDKGSIKSCSNCEEKRICYGCGEKGHLKHQCPRTTTNGNGSKDGNHHMEDQSKVKCYRCMRAGHIARECFARKTLDGVMLPIPGEEKGKVTHLTDGEVPLPKQKMSVIHERDEEGEVDVSSAEEDY